MGYKSVIKCFECGTDMDVLTFTSFLEDGEVLSSYKCPKCNAESDVVVTRDCKRILGVAWRTGGPVCPV